MTLETLYDMSAEKLEAMSDLELIAFFEPYFNISRPERAAKHKRKENEPVITLDIQKRLAALQQMGIKVTAKDMVMKKK